MAHFLHNLFFVLGDEMDSSADLREATAEIYRAYPIENFDSAACRVVTVEGVELLYYVSHAVPEKRGPLFRFEFEKAVVSYGEFSNSITAEFYKGKKKEYGSPESRQFKKLRVAIDAARKPIPVVCGPEASRPQTLCINGIQESFSDIRTIPDEMIEKSGNNLQVKQLADAFYKSYQEGILPCEGKYSWTSAGKTINLENYCFFPGGVYSTEKEEK
jgi:hypothetical protein